MGRAKVSSMFPAEKEQVFTSQNGCHRIFPRIIYFNGYVCKLSLVEEYFIFTDKCNTGMERLVQQNLKVSGNILHEQNKQ